MNILKHFSALILIRLASSKRLGFKDGGYISKLVQSNEENLIIISKDNNSIELDEKVYYLNDLLQEENIFSSNFLSLQDGKAVENEFLYTFWSGFMNGADVFMTKDENGNIESLTIMIDFDVKSFIAVEKTTDGNNKSAGFLKKLDKNLENELGYLSTVMVGGDFIITKDTKSYSSNNVTHHADFLNNNFTSFYEEDDAGFLNNKSTYFYEKDGNSSSILSSYSRCSFYKQIDVAIAYDTTFCKLCGGSDNARKIITQIISLASYRYRQQGLCLKIRLSALEGHCNVQTDPYLRMRHYNSGCSGDGLLQDFTEFWHYNRKHIPRDAAHLFVGGKFQDGKIGCAGIGTLCRGAYGVESMSYFQDMTTQSLLFTHELGHNCGADHSSDPSSIMYPYIADGSNGFSAKTSSSMLNYLQYQNCLKVVA